MYTLEEIDGLVDKYQTTKDGESLEVLIDAFDPFITKWINIATGNYINVQDPEVGQFVSLYNLDDISSLRTILRKATADMNEYDVRSELLLIFIQKVINFKYNCVHFPGYLKSTYKYDVYRWINNRLRYREVYDGELYDRMVDGIASKPLGIPDTNIISDPTILPCLTPKEKMILTLKYMDGMSTEDIADIYGYRHPNSITNIISKAKRKLSEWLKEPQED